MEFIKAATSNQAELLGFQRVTRPTDHGEKVSRLEIGDSKRAEQCQLISRSAGGEIKRCKSRRPHHGDNANLERRGSGWTSEAIEQVRVESI